MIRCPKHWLAGCVVAEVQTTKAGVRLMLNTFIRSSEAFAVVRCLDRNERAIADDDGKPLTLCNIEMSLAGPRPILFGLRYQRPRQIFGRYSQFYHDSILVDVPKEIWRTVAYVELDIFTAGLHSEVNKQDESASGNDEWVHLEMSRKKLAAFGPPKLFLMISKRAARKRMEKLLRKCPELRRQHDDVRHALSSLMTKLFRGGDNELLTEDL